MSHPAQQDRHEEPIRPLRHRLTTGVRARLAALFRRHPAASTEPRFRPDFWYPGTNVGISHRSHPVGAEYFQATPPYWCGELSTFVARGDRFGELTRPTHPGALNAEDLTPGTRVTRHHTNGSTTQFLVLAPPEADHYGHPTVKLLENPDNFTDEDIAAGVFPEHAVNDLPLHALGMAPGPEGRWDPHHHLTLTDPAS